MNLCEVPNAASSPGCILVAQTLMSGILGSSVSKVDLAVFRTSKYKNVRVPKSCQVDLAVLWTSTVEVWNAARLLGSISDLEI